MLKWKHKRNGKGISIHIQHTRYWRRKAKTKEQESDNELEGERESGEGNEKKMERQRANEMSDRFHFENDVNEIDEEHEQANGSRCQLEKGAAARAQQSMSLNINHPNHIFII